MNNKIYISALRTLQQPFIIKFFDSLPAYTLIALEHALLPYNAQFVTSNETKNYIEFVEEEYMTKFIIDWSC